MKKASSLLRLAQLRHNVASPQLESSAASTAGYALPMAFALGLSMLALAATSILLAQDGRDTAALRRDSAASVLVTDSAIAEILTAFNQDENMVLLGRNYDPINPDTGTTFLGVDGIPNTGDETNSAVNAWNVTPGDYDCDAALNIQTPNINLAQTVSPVSGYQILAYRFDETLSHGYLLVQGSHQGISSYVHISLALKDDWTNMPGLAASQEFFWQGRTASGQYSNFFFNPDASTEKSLNAVAASDAPDRAQYLDAIWSGNLDGFTGDSLTGKGIACELTFSLPANATGPSLGDITTGQVLTGSGGAVQAYQADSITLVGTDELVVDTTDGPVHLYVKGATILRGSSKIRNVRSDGQVPKVGDLRLIQTDKDASGSVVLYDTPCIDNVFIYAPEGSFQQLTTAAGCAGPIPTNVQGVIWAEKFQNSTNSATTRTYDRKGSPDVMTTGVDAGVIVPDSVENLGDAIASVNLPRRFKISGVISWTNVGL